jgi:steroid delta-isomerase-like uncharacterized protein
MSVEDLKALGRRYIEELNKGKAAALAAMDELYATDLVFHGGGGEETRGIENYKQSVREFFNAFSDLHWIIDDIIAEGDKVVARFTLTGTNTGEFMGIPPTNKKVTMWVISIDRIVGGKFVEEWERMDTLGFMQQLSLVPTPKKEK